VGVKVGLEFTFLLVDFFPYTAPIVGVARVDVCETFEFIFGLSFLCFRIFLELVFCSDCFVLGLLIQRIFI
jgi:hypothetical protein